MSPFKENKTYVVELFISGTPDEVVAYSYEVDHGTLTFMALVTGREGHGRWPVRSYAPGTWKRVMMLKDSK